MSKKSAADAAISALEGFGESEARRRRTRVSRGSPLVAAARKPPPPPKRRISAATTKTTTFAADFHFHLDAAWTMLTVAVAS